MFKHVLISHSALLPMQSYACSNSAGNIPVIELTDNAAYANNVRPATPSRSHLLSFSSMLVGERIAVEFFRRCVSGCHLRCFSITAAPAATALRRRVNRVLIRHASLTGDYQGNHEPERS